MRRRRLKRLLWRSSMWSAMGGGGGNSGTRRCSGSAGGSLRLMALSSATPSGGLRGTLVNVPVTMLDKFQQSWFLLWKSLQSCSSCSSSPCRMCSVLRFSSSTECWTFQLGSSLAMHSAHCAQDRGVPQVQVLGMVLSACCCATTGAVADPSRGCLVRQ